MKSKIFIIIGREFKERVAKKSFIITTLLMPVLMVVFSVLPVLIATFSTPSDRTIAVADESGVIVPALLSAKIDHMTFIPVSQADLVLKDDKYDAVLTIQKDVVESPKNSVKLYQREAGSMEAERILSEVIKNKVEDIRLAQYDIDNLDKILADVKADVSIQTIKIDDNGEGKTTSTTFSFFLGLAMAFLLYMILLMYGQMVMSSIIEEKSNRVLELVVTSVKPIQLMLGKILGMGLVAVTQIVIWGVLMCAVSAFLLPLILPESLGSQVEMFQSGALDPSAASVDLDLLQAISVLGSVGFILKIFGYIILFLIGGFLFYASIFAAIGSSVDSDQEASQLVSFATIPIIIGLIGGIAAAEDPSGQLAIWLSMIPFTSPMVMMIRIPFEVPGWQIAVSLVVLYASFVGMAWIAAKIYRIGIFMHGKKPTIKDLYRWSTYK